MKRGPAPSWFPLRRQILDSSVWEEPPTVRVLWITALLLGSEPGRRGIIDVTLRSLAGRACLTLEETEAALKVLMAPDARSRSRAKDGKRLELIDPSRDWGWSIVNWEAYADTMTAAGSTLRSREHRAAVAPQPNETQRNATERTDEKEKEKEKEKETERERTPPRTPRRGARAPDPRFDAFYEAFPNHVKRREAEKAWQALSEENREAAMAAVKVYAEVWRKAPADRLSFVPHPASWLRGERWTDSREAWERDAAPRTGGAATRAADPRNRTATAGMHRAPQAPPREAEADLPLWVKVITDADGGGLRPALPPVLEEALWKWKHDHSTPEPDGWEALLATAMADAKAWNERVAV